jgi:hypothetical protein
MLFLFAIPGIPHEYKAANNDGDQQRTQWPGKIHGRDPTLLHAYRLCQRKKTSIKR